MKKISLLWSIVMLLTLLLSACRSEPAEPTPTEPNPDLVFTAAAQTAQAMMTEIAAQTPTQAPPTATNTPEPPTATIAPTTAAPAATSTVTIAAGATAGDNSEFSADITIPDGTDFQPNASFEKTWQLKNTGSTTWTTAYSLAFIQGEQMSGAASVPVPSQVAPGQTVNISVNLVAPSSAGNYKGFWRLKNASGQLFGTSVYVEIDVTGSGATSTTGPTSTAGTPGTPTVTNTPSGTSASVSDLSIVVEDASFTGECPHTFSITAEFTLDQAATVTYRLEAGSDTAGFEIDVPDPVTNNLNAGTHTLVYNLDFSASISGWARLRITQPADVASNQATFSLTCQ